MYLKDYSGGKQVVRTAAVCFTEEGERIAEKLPDLEVYRHGKEFTDTRHMVRQLFEGSHRVSAVIFFSSVGIAVRLTAPYAIDKMTDPAVIVVDDTAEFVIPVLSGHMGKANQLAVKLAGLLGAQAVITTASDRRNGLDVPDLWAEREGYTITDRGDVKKVSAAIVAGGVPERIRSGETVVWSVSPAALTENSDQNPVTAMMTPRKYVIGLGCRKGSSTEILKQFVEQKLSAAGIPLEDIFKICSIDLKAEEGAILDLAREFHRPFVVFSAEQLNRIKGEFSTSSFVETVTGTDNVCERSALAGCAPWDGKLILRKYAEHGMTIAIAERNMSSKALENG